MKRIIWFLAFLVLICGIQFMFLEKATNTELTDTKPNNLPTVQANSPAEKAGLQFLQTTMQSPNGLIYYLVEHKSSASYSVLESMGQAMEYAALIGDGKLFDQYAKTTHTYFEAPTGYYYWKVDIATHKGETSSALVDDLRLIKAYFIANEKKLGQYDAQLADLSEVVFQSDIDANGYPCDYYDGEAGKRANEVSLFYLDVETLSQLRNLNSKWLIPYARAKGILLSMPENEYGFYPKTFKINTKQYIWGSSINMVENLYTAIDAYTAGKNTRPLVTFLKKQVKKGKIYNLYNLDGTPVDQDESTAVYALAARFLALNNEHEAAEWCYRRTLQFQINDQKSFDGGFGESDTGLVYAFDQLEALLMLRRVEANNVSQ